MATAEVYYFDRPGAHGDSTRIAPAERLRQGSDRRSFRESVAAQGRFRDRRARQIYQASLEGVPLREIAARFGLNKETVGQHIRRAERAAWADGDLPADLTRQEVTIWRAWLRGESSERIRKRRAPDRTEDEIEGVVERVKRHARRQPTKTPRELARRCSRTFVRQLGDLSPDAVLEAAQNDPDLAEMIALILRDQEVANPPKGGVHTFLFGS